MVKKEKTPKFYPGEDAIPKNPPQIQKKAKLRSEEYSGKKPVYMQASLIFCKSVPLGTVATANTL